VGVFEHVFVLSCLYPKQDVVDVLQVYHKKIRYSKRLNLIRFKILKTFVWTNNTMTYRKTTIRQITVLKMLHRKLMCPQCIGSLRAF